ncbi:hypothetical protein [uncultured Pelagimonas sp.]|uniref:hypothetical protein n=1 Tax=uncultured Pelagimonas sp. TaxID=1618102 RepID=UPI0026357916|nr:hypothetical protein [uncultured Pelagimonas sp.]
MAIQTIDQATYAKERALCIMAQNYAEQVMSEGGDKRVRNHLTAEEAKHPAYAACDNDMRGRVEQFELLNDTPEVFTCYVDSTGRASVWTGLPLSQRPGTVSSKWRVHSHIGTHMHQYYFTIAGREFTGRGFGEGMCITLRETAASKAKRAEVAA